VDVDPPVTVIEQPTYEIGQTATELLLKRIEAPDRPTREVILKGRLIVRHSCGDHTSKNNASVTVPNML
jgi:LacI family fructose operon transcriptional repressor